MGLLLPFASVFLSANIASAVTFTVNTTTDELNFVKCTPQTPNNCSLRTALIWANQLAGADTIVLPQGTYRLTRLGNEPWPTTNPTVNDFDISGSTTIKGAGVGKTIIDGMGNYRVFQIRHTGSTPQAVVFEDLSIRGGKISEAVTDGNYGAAIGVLADGFDAPPSDHWLVLRRVRLFKNQIDAKQGGAILSVDGHNVWLEDTEIDQNYGLNPDLNPNTTSGPIDIRGAKSVEIHRSRIHHNTTPLAKTFCMMWFVNADNVWIDQTEISNNDWKHQICLNVIDTTLISNSTLSGNAGSAIQHNGSSQHVGELALLHVTITNNNLKGLTGAAIIRYGSNNLWLKNTIIAEQKTGTDCDVIANVDRVYSLGNNLDSDESCDLDQPTDHPNVDALLGPLQWNGGFNYTHMPEKNSPAINAGETLPDVLVDQRGVARPVGTSSDIGAVERNIWVFEPCSPGKGCIPFPEK